MEAAIRLSRPLAILAAIYLLAACAGQTFHDPHWFIDAKPQKIALRQVQHADKQRTIHGYLFKSATGNGRLVIYGPGCNGADTSGRNYHADHIKRFHAGGLDVLLLNSVSDRGLGEGGTCFISSEDKRFVSTPMISADALTAVKWARDNGYAPGRIGYFGFSHGARAGIWLAGERSLRNNTPAELKAEMPNFATIVLVYPACVDWTQYNKGVGPLATSLLIWGGDKDESEPAACVNFFPEALRKAELRIRIFPDTYHGYGFNAPMRVTIFAKATKITSAYNPQAHEETFSGSVAWFNARLK
jgi:dienelactone hydrolase